MIDIIFVILFHEEIESIFDTLNNIFFFTSELNIKIIIEICPSIYSDELKERLESVYKSNVIISKSFKKEKYTIDIYKGILDGLSKLKDLEYKCTCLLTSNTLFLRKISKDNLDVILKIIKNNNPENFELLPNTIYTHILKVPNNWHFPTFLGDKTFRRIIIENKYSISANLHEGIILLPEHIKKIFELENTYNLSSNMYRNCPWEEILFTTVISSFKHYFLTICRVLHYFPDWKLNDEQLQEICKDNWNILKKEGTDLGNDFQFCIKPIDRSYNHPQRKFIREYFNY